MKQVTQIGVDVDSEELVCAMQRAGQRQPLATFANTAAGHKKFIRWATKGGRPARVCLEATGIYSLEFALALHHAKNVEVMVVNPRAIKDFARACMQRAKTDAVDAGGILDYLERMPFVAWQPPAPEILELQAINRRIVQLNTELTREKNRRHAAEFAGASADAIAHDIEVNIHHLERRIERMHDSGLKLVRGVPALATKLAHLVSTKGIAETSAMRLLARTPGAPGRSRRPAVGGPCRARSAPLRVGHLGPSPAAHQQSRQPPSARRALHARPGGHSTRAQRQSLLQQTRRRREEADASRGRGDAQIAARHLGHAQARSGFRRRKILQDREQKTLDRKESI